MSIKARIISIVALVIGLAVLAGPVSAKDSDTTYGGGNIQAYNAPKDLDIGTIVELTGEKADTVKPSSEKQLQNMFGVVIDRNTLPIVYSHENLNNPTYVAVSGTYNTLVSTQAGNIKPGDYLTMSSINGVAMKAGSDKKTVFGRAYGSFDGRMGALGTSQLKDVNGQPNQTVKLGLIPVTIDIKQNPTIKTTKADLPDFLVRAGQAIAEKEVSPVRIYLSAAIAVISLLIAIAVLYTGIRSSVISIGRNPMSKKSIFRALMEIILTSLLILIIGLFGVYLLLKLW